MCAATAGDETRVRFDRDIQPLLAETCFACHGPDAATREADLRLDIRESALEDRGGYAAIVPGKTEESDLLRRITSRDNDQRMPPPDAPRQLDAEQIELIKRWIEQGADWSQQWSLKTPLRPESPAVENGEWIQNGVDPFVLTELERAGVTPAPRATRETLIRRVTLALTGVPPAPQEVDAFLADESPAAFRRLVDRLLSSPRYGEHMARPWLDAARYADTDGYQNDRIRYMWAWRDWVIHALNINMPFDQFTIEQLAGDMLPDATLYQQIATGFGRNHRINSEGGSIPEEWHVEYVVDRVDTLGTVWLGLTVGCARCHDHKYDPISQREYYQLYAYFNNVPEWGLGPNNGNSPPFINLPKSWPHVSKHENRLIPPAPYKLNTTQTSVVRPNPGGPNTVMVMQEMPKPRATYLLRRGQYNLPDKSQALQPNVPASLEARENVAPTNRLELARWLVDSKNPLTARVIVNRYWQHFFGLGLVKTSENFGIQGESPSHPQLLDWLATEFVRSGWDVKRLHRLIVTSATYQQSSSVTRKLRRIDPENRLLGRGPRFRLSAHTIRDQALGISGLLVEELGGPSVKPYMPPRIWKSISNNKYQQDHGRKLYRRSLYTYWRRTVPPPSMMTFNAAEREVCLVRKDRTTTPLQALTLMNNIVYVETARFMAERMMNEAGPLLADRLAYGFRLATGRPPKMTELAAMTDAYDAFFESYSKHVDKAKLLLSVGEAPRNGAIDAAEHAALTMTANLLMNLDETITLE